MLRCRILYIYSELIQGNNTQTRKQKKHMHIQTHRHTDTQTKMKNTTNFRRELISFGNLCHLRRLSTFPTPPSFGTSTLKSTCRNTRTNATPTGHIRTNTHTYTHTRTYTHEHTRTFTHTHTHIHTHTYTHTRSKYCQLFRQFLTQVHCHFQSCLDTVTLKFTCRYTHTSATRTRTHTDTHAY